jgi:hypothetical protein
VEPQRCGGIESHLADTKTATAKWLEWEALQHAKASEKEAFLLDLAMAGADKPEQPEALTLLRHTRRFGALYYSGGLANQPFLTTLELNAVIEAENEHIERQLANERLKAAYARAKRKNEEPP